MLEGRDAALIAVFIISVPGVSDNQPTIVVRLSLCMHALREAIVALRVTLVTPKVEAD